MDYFNLYKTRLGAESMSESFAKSTIDFLQRTFVDSPNYKAVFVNGIEIGVRCITTNKQNILQLMSLPDCLLNKGDIVAIDGQEWLVMDSISRLDIFNIATVNRCNERLVWKDKNDVIHNCPCLAQSFSLSNFKIEGGVVEGVVTYLPTGKLNIYARYDEETSQVYVGQRFLFGKSAYKIVGIDDLTDVTNGVGLAKFTVELTEGHKDDDYENKIAYNGDNDDENGGDDGVLW